MNFFITKASEITSCSYALSRETPCISSHLILVSAHKGDEPPKELSISSLGPSRKRHITVMFTDHYITAVPQYAICVMSALRRLRLGGSFCILANLQTFELPNALPSW